MAMMASSALQRSLLGTTTEVQSSSFVFLPPLLSFSAQRRHGRSCVVSAASSDAPAAKAEAPPKKAAAPKKPVPTMKKGQIVRVDKEKYLNSVEYLAVGHPLNFKGLDYIYEDRGEVLDVRFYETGEYALIGWAGIPTSPAWLPTYMLVKVDKLSYKRT